MQKEKLWTKNFILIVIVSLFAGFLVSLFLNTLPVYVEQMSGTAVYAGIVTTTYTLAALITRPVVGIICERVGVIRLIMVGLILMTVACYSYTFATTVTMLMIIRVIHGIGFGIKSTASGVLVADIIPKSRFAEGIGMFGLYLPVSNAIGPAFGLWIADSGSFKSLFLIAGILGIISILLMINIKTDKAGARECGPMSETVTLNEAAVSDEVVALQETLTTSVTDSEETETDSSKLPKTFLGFEFGVVYPSAVLLLMYIGYSAIVSFVALYAISESIKGIGLFYTIGAIALFVARFAFAKLVHTYGYHRFVIASIILFALVLFIIPRTDSILILYILAVFYGAALGIVPMAVNAQVLERCSTKRRGTAMAAYTSSMDIGIGLGSLIIGFVVELCGFEMGFCIAGCSCVAAVILYTVTVARDHTSYKKRIEKANGIDKN